MEPPIDPNEEIEEGELTLEELLAGIVADIPSKPEVKALSSSKVKMTWDAVSSDHHGYTVQTATNASFTEGLKSDTVFGYGTTSYTFTDLECGEERYYRVRSFKEAAPSVYVYSGWSRVVEFVTVPETPEIIGHEVISSTKVKLIWTQVDDCDGYILLCDGEDIYYNEDKTKTSYTDTGLTLGEKYVYRVLSHKNGYESEESEAYEYTPIPDTPKNFKAEPKTMNSIRLTWDAVDGIDGYWIYRSTNGGATFTKLATAFDDETEYIDTKNIVCGNEYMYYIVAYLSESIFSDPSPTRAVMTYPAAPSGVKAVFRDSTSITVSWDEVADVGGYIVQVSEDNASYTDIAILGDTSYIHTGLPAGKKFFYRVYSFMGSYGSEIRSDPSLVVYEYTRPGVPQNLKLNNSAYNVNQIVWDAVDGAVGYEVVRKSPERVIDTIKPYAGDGQNIQCGASYTYKVRAYVLDGTTRIYGNYSEEKTIKARPAKVTGLTLTQDPDLSEATNVNLTWNKVTGASGYYVYLPDGTQKTVSGGDTLKYTATKMALLEKIDFEVSAYRTVDGTRVEGEKVKESIKLNLYPVADFKAANATVNSTKLSWKAHPGVTGYVLTVKGYFADSGKEETKEYKQTETSKTIDNLVCGYSYEATVRPYKVVDNEEKIGPVKNLTFSQALGAPKNLKARALSAKYGANLTWSKVEDADGYIIYRSENEGSGYTFIARRDGSQTLEYNDVVDATHLGRKYFYKVTAYVESLGATPVESAKSASASMTVLPPMPEVEIYEDTAVSIRLTWNTISGADGYIIERADVDSSGSTGAYKIIDTIDNPYADEYVSSGLTTGKTYAFRVRAYADRPNGAGETVRLLGAYSSKKTGTTSPRTPTGLAASWVENDVTLTWNAVEGCDGYIVHRSVDGGAYEAYKTVEGGATTKFVNSDIALHRKYAYKLTSFVRAYGNKVESKQTSAVTVEPKLAKVTNFRITERKSSSIKLKWNKVIGADGYFVQMATKSDYSAYADAATISSGDTLETTIKDLPLGKRRYFRIKAYVKKGDEKITLDGNDKWAYVDGITVPDTPSSVTFSDVTHSAITVKWSDVPAADGFYLFYNTTGLDSGWKYMYLEGDNITSYRLTGLDPNTTYYFKIKPFYRDEFGDRIEGVSTKIYNKRTAEGPSVPSTPTNVKFTNVKDTQITVTWDKVTSAHGFYIFCGTNSSNPTLVAKIRGYNLSSYTVTGLTPGKAYYFKIKPFADTSSGEVTGNSTKIYTQATTGGAPVVAPATPTGLHASSVGQTSLTIAWNLVPEADGYYIFCSDSTNPKLYKTVTAANLSAYTITGLNPATTYYFKVKPFAVDTLGNKVEGASTAVKSATTNP